MPKPILIGIGGGTASGKSTLVDHITSIVLPDEVAVLREDWYYKDQSDIDFEDRLKTNYDHPDSFDNELLLSHIRNLLSGKPVDSPTYDFTRHTRAQATVLVRPAKVVIIEGILVLHHRDLRDLMDIKIYVDTDSDLRILRRLKRDITERGRTFESVTDRYLNDVRPMHRKFVEPTKYYADLVIPFGRFNTVVIELLSIIINERYRREGRGPKE